MAKFISIVLCLSVAGYAFGLECFQCKTNEKCEQENEMMRVKCGQTATPNSETLCVQKKFEDVQTKAVTYYRSCVIVDSKQDECKHEDTKTKQVSCNLCKTDFCNGHSSSVSLPSLNMYAIIGATFSIFCTKYFLQ